MADPKDQNSGGDRTTRIRRDPLLDRGLIGAACLAGTLAVWQFAGLVSEVRGMRGDLSRVIAAHDVSEAQRGADHATIADHETRLREIEKRRTP